MATVDMSGSHLAGRSEISSDKLSVFRCRDATCDKDSLVVFRGTDLRGASFLRTNIEGFVFSDVRWATDGRSPRRLLWDEMLHRSAEAEGGAGGRTASTKPRRPIAAEGNLEEVAENYRQLVLNYEGRRDYEAAEDFHIGEMEMRRRMSRGIEAVWGIGWAVGRARRWLEGKAEKHRTTLGWVRVRRLRQEGEKGHFEEHLERSWPAGEAGELKRHRAALRMLRWLREWVNPYALYLMLSRYGTSYVRALAVLIGFVGLFAVGFLYAGFQPTATRGSATEIIEYDLHPDAEHKSAALDQIRADFMAAFVYSLSVGTLQRERYYQPLDSSGRSLVILGTVILPAQGTLVLFALRRRFKR